ncbi:MAG: hypothetical protein HC913_22365 [Microscillaceae bacterium]|nr:hypothetical protein [Microscillaceae bacterium]
MALTLIQQNNAQLIFLKKGNRPKMSAALKWSLIASLPFGILFLALGFGVLLSLLIFGGMFVGIYLAMLLIFFLLLEEDSFYIFDKNAQKYSLQMGQADAKGNPKKAYALSAIQKVFTQYNSADNETFLMLATLENGKANEHYLDIATGEGKFQIEKEMIEKR